MSIKSELKRLVDEEVLWCVEPFPGDKVTRTILVSSPINSMLQSASLESRVGQLRANLQGLVAGDELSISFESYKHRKATFGIMDPAKEGIWEIRDRNPSPGLRLFGKFAAVDWFVAIAWRPRSRPLDGFDKEPLQGRHSLEYQFAQIEVNEFWSTHLAHFGPVLGDKCGDYFSERCTVSGAAW
jgi:hypothetical protein